jgi:acyl dehydratase
MQEFLPFEKLQVGQRHASRARTVTEADVINFAGVSGDFDSLHVDREFAAQTPFGQTLAHGLLGLSWVTGMATYCPPVRTEAFLGIREWKFLKPIFIGDTLHLVNEVAELQEKGRRRGRVLWRRQLVNQRGEVVQEGYFETYVSKSRETPKGPHFDSKAAAETSDAPTPVPGERGPSGP